MNNDNDDKGDCCNDAHNDEDGCGADDAWKYMWYDQAGSVVCRQCWF